LNKNFTNKKETKSKIQHLKNLNMKKLLYILILAITRMATISSCTEENVTPRTDNPPAGAGSAPKGS
jgi:hypothetical protein